ncbi:YceH family protein [Variovorax sp. PCZ-1]|uniref:YceH family protein n=1 Tax=Variovorax sp. PCZ-1 TaxID=2835533 RepID=UPI001BCA99C1|nr:YceH family protein [Variovorax sp. PCZ-1]MBS7806614.1 YceH family protein [Variovorax sp. PCZ-1]
MKILTPIEARVLGTLMEKARTVPDSYPLSLNALVLGCNQKSSRDPIMEVMEDDARAALDALKTRSLVFEASSSRVPRYEHNVCRALGVSDDQGAILGLLMLRGPQTPAELRTNGDRWTKFADSAAVESMLEELQKRGEDGGLQSVVKLPKMPGSREHRWAHLLCGEIDLTALSASASAFVPTDDSLGRLTKLENEVAQLKASNAQLQSTLRHVCEQLGIEMPAEPA